MYVSEQPGFGGAEVSLLTTIQGLPKENFSSILLTESGTAILDAARSMNITTIVHEFPWFRKRNPIPFLKSVWGLVQILIIHNIDIIHTNSCRSLPHIRWAREITRVPHVAHVRDFQEPWFEGMFKQALLRANVLIAISRAMVKKYGAEGFEQGKVRLIYNPFRLERFEHATPMDLRPFGVPDKCFKVGFMANIQPIKGFRDFIEAALIVLQKHTNIHFIIGGEVYGNENRVYFDNVMEMVATASAEEKFTYLGFVNDVSRFMKTIDLLVVPSYIESFGRVAVEACAAGTPVIATGRGGLLDIVRDSENGLLVEPKNPTQLASTIERIIIDRDLYAHLARNAADSVKRFSVENHVRELAHLYDTLFASDDYRKYKHRMKILKKVLRIS